MKKIYLLSLAAAAMFASCSNEMDEFAQQTDQKGFKLDIAVAEDAPETRLTMNDNGLNTTWDLGDTFSFFNVGAISEENAAFTATANAAYKYEKEEEGSEIKKFTSPNVLFNGNHVLVFPLNKEYTKAGEVIKVAPLKDGNLTLGERNVFLSKTVVNVQEPAADAEQVNMPGYGNPLKVAVRPATASFIFTLKPTVDMTTTGDVPAVKIQKVSLMAENVSPFAESSKLFEKTVTPTIGESKGKTGKYVIAGPDTETKVAEVVYEEGKEPIFAKNNVKVSIVALPVITSVAPDNYRIHVQTNYGVVEIKGAALVTNPKNNQIQTNVPALLTSENKDDRLSFDKEISTIIARAAVADPQPTIQRTVAVDVTAAKIDNIKIRTSEDLLDAYRIYEFLKKGNEVVFTLTPNTDGEFVLTKKAVEAINAHEARVVPDTDVKKIILTGYGKEAENAIPEFKTVKVGAKDKCVFNPEGADLELVLAEENNWKINVKDAAAANVFNCITNKGNLVIFEETQNPAGEQLAETIENDGTVSFTGTVTMPVAINDLGEITRKVNGEDVIIPAVMNVVSGNIVTLKGSTFSSSSINVAVGATLIVPAEETVLLNSETTVNLDGKFLTNSGGVLKNEARITLGDESGLIMSENGTDGVIDMSRKDNNVSIEENNGKTKLEFAGATIETGADKNAGTVANYIVYTGGGTLTVTADLEVEVTGNGALVTAVEGGISNLIVNEGVSLDIPLNNTAKVRNLNNNGIISVFGTFDYPNSVTKKGNIFVAK